MATSQFWFGANSINDTVTNAIAALGSVTGTQRVLVVFWDDVKGSLSNSNAATPDSGEDWLAAINFKGVDVTISTQNSARKAVFSVGNLSIDQGFYLAGQTFEVYPVTANFYVPSSLAPRPKASDL